MATVGCWHLSRPAHIHSKGSEIGQVLTGVDVDLVGSKLEPAKGLHRGHVIRVHLERRSVGQAESDQGYYGLGQMGKAACDDVDRAYNFPPGTCWRSQQSNDPCDQIANSIAYLHHVLVNKNDFGHDGTLRGGLRKYEPTDAGFNGYADPVLRCARCIRDDERFHREDKGGPRGVEFCTPETAQSCFDKMNKDVAEERRKRLDR